MNENKEKNETDLTAILSASDCLLLNVLMDELSGTHGSRNHCILLHLIDEAYEQGRFDKGTDAEIERLSPESKASVKRGLTDVANGNLVDLGDFTQHLKPDRFGVDRSAPVTSVGSTKKKPEPPAVVTRAHYDRELKRSAAQIAQIERMRVELADANETIRELRTRLDEVGQ